MDDQIPGARTVALANEALDDVVNLDLSSMGSTGLKQWGGIVREELLPQLDGPNGLRIYREMGENDAVCSGVLYALDKVIRQCAWPVEAASGLDEDKRAAEFLESCIDDMEMGFTELVSEFLTMLPYGFSAHEICYKMRAGSSDNVTFNSKYADGRIGWRGMPIRSQDTIQRWMFDDSGSLLGLQQLAPPKYTLVDIPMEKLLLFRTTSHKNNPQGKSILRGAYRSWYYKSRIEAIEAVGAERDLAGLPVAWAPPEILNPNADPKKKAIFNALKNIVTNIRNDSQAAVILPLSYDANGNKMFDFQLMSSGGARQFDTDKIIQRYDQRIALSMLADFMLLGAGAGATGSFAMHTDKSKLFLLAASTFLDIIVDVFNNVAIPRLFRLNAFPLTEYPRLTHGSIEGADLGVIGAYLTALSQIGMPLFPNATLEAHLLEIGGLPATQNEVPLMADQQVEQASGVGQAGVTEQIDPMMGEGEPAAPQASGAFPAAR